MNLYEHIINAEYNIKVTENLYEDLVYSKLINESFQSDLLRNLAKEIKKAEEPIHQKDIANAKQWYTKNFKPSPNAKTFSSIFGPIGYRGGKVQGLKWDEIKDSDFVFIKAGSPEKAFKKALKPIFKGEANGDIIVCEPGTKEPFIFIKGYGNAISSNSYDYESKSTQAFYFSDNLTNYKTGVRELTASKGKYKSRPIKLAELLPNILDYDVYVLNITEDMTKTYSDLDVNRQELQKGIINFDNESLRRILANQQARYKVLVKELKTKKLEANPEKLFDEIKELNDKVVDLYKRIISKPEYMDKYIDIGSLMQYVTAAYDTFYSMSKSKREYTKGRDYAMNKAKERGEEFNQAEYDKHNYTLSDTKNGIRKVDEYIKTIKQRIKDIESNL